METLSSILNASTPGAYHLGEADERAGGMGG